MSVNFQRRGFKTCSAIVIDRYVSCWGYRGWWIITDDVLLQAPIAAVKLHSNGARELACGLLYSCGFMCQVKSVLTGVTSGTVKDGSIQPSFTCKAKGVISHDLSSMPLEVKLETLHYRRARDGWQPHERIVTLTKACAACAMFLFSPGTTPLIPPPIPTVKSPYGT